MNTSLSNGMTTETMPIAATPKKRGRKPAVDKYLGKCVVLRRTSGNVRVAVREQIERPESKYYLTEVQEITSGSSLLNIGDKLVVSPSEIKYGMIVSKII